jgi:hypothetical protein
VGCALAALDTGAFTQRRVRGAGDSPLNAPAQKFQGPDILHFLTHFYTASAAYTLFRIQHDGRIGIVNGQVVHYFAVGAFPDTKVGGKFLEFAVAVPGTLEAVIRMIGKDQFQNSPAGGDYLRVMGDNVFSFQTGVYLGDTGAHYLGAAGNADYAKAAGRPGGKIGVITQSRNFQVYFFSRVKDCCSLFNLNRFPVYCKVYHRYYSFSLALEDGAEFTGVKTLAALKTSRLINYVWRPLFVRILCGILNSNTVGGALLGAGSAAYTLDGINGKAYQFFAFAGAAFPVMNMLQMLVPEILQCGQDRACRGLAEHTKRRFCHGHAD